MEFYIEKHSSTPVAKQIEEQIKHAVMMGIFRNGDTLPSIRDIEKQTGIHRSQIHKAFQGLRQSGLLVLTRGKGSVITTAKDSPKSINENCHKLSNTVISKVRQLGISPTAFARYLSRQAQENERIDPFIVYVDSHEEIAAKTATEISKLWQVPVIGMEFQDINVLAAENPKKQRYLVNHVMCEYVRSLLPGKKSAVIPIEVHYSKQTIRSLANIGADSSVQLITLPQPSHRIRYMILQMRKLLKSPEIKITTVSIDADTDYKKLLNRAEYDYFLVGPGVRGEIPSKMRQDPRIILLDPVLDPVSLEAARIRAGVII